MIEPERCPQCGGEDLSTGPVANGDEVTVCFTCSWDSDHGATTQLCPGACGRWIGQDVLCCDPCWDRIPTRVPDLDRPWRTARRYARSFRNWTAVDHINEAVRAWLVAHPARKKVNV